MVRVWRSWSWLDAEAVKRKLAQVLRLDGKDLDLASRVLVGRSRPACSLVSAIYEDLPTKKSTSNILIEHLRLTRRSIVKELEKLVHDEPNFSVSLADYFLGLHRSWPGLVPLEAFQPQRDGVFHTMASAGVQDWRTVNLAPEGTELVSVSSSAAAPGPLVVLEPLAYVALQSFVLKHPEQLLAALANRLFGRATPQAGAAELDRLVAMLLVFLSRDSSDAAGLSVTRLISELLRGTGNDDKAEVVPPLPQWVDTLMLPRLDLLRTSDLADSVRQNLPEVPC